MTFGTSPTIIIKIADEVAELDFRRQTLTCQEKDANEVRVGGVDRLEDLFEGVGGVLLAKRASRYKVGHPERVEGRKLIDLVRPLEPVLPVIHVLVVDHAAHPL